MNGWTKLGFVAVATLVLAATFSVSSANAAQKVTFEKDILPILQENCQTCHRPAGRNMSGMIAPMSLLTYREVRPWAKALGRAVAGKEMPPWYASEAQHGSFRNERTLSAEDIATIGAWIKQGAPRGNPKDAPEPVEWPVGWNMGEPDMIIDFGTPFFVGDDIVDLYHNITVSIPEESLPEDKWIQGVEFRPGSEVVHHIIAYSSYKDENGKDVRGQIGGLAPGTDPADFPEGYGYPLHKDSTVTFAMHYHKEAGPGTGQFDNSVMAIKFHDKPVKYELQTSNIAHGAFEIPPFHPHWVVSGGKLFKEDTQLMGFMPHGHLRTIAASYTAFYPDGTTEVLLDVPNYNFNWQTAYGFKEPRILPAGTRLEFEIVYDNSQENADRVGFNPARPVSFGGPTTDEMDLGWFSTASTTPIGAAGAGD